MRLASFPCSLRVLVTVNLIAWIWAWVAFADKPALLGSALLAWLFGLRHAADADHLAAIDNVVRKLMQDGGQPRLVGLFFSLGHSTIVILACGLIAATASSTAMAHFAPLGGMIGSAVSAGFLLLIAVVNLSTLIGLLQRRETDRSGGPTGLLAHVLRPVMRLVRRPAHMYPVGFLFGLGFDTATEVGLLALAATQAASGVSFAQVLIFPALFTAGMALIDTADSVLMVGAYGWALTDPARKRRYNITVTTLSVILAVAIGGMEAGGLLAAAFGLHGAVWNGIDALSDQFSNLGFAVIAVFLAVWAASVWITRRRPAGADQVAVQPPSTS